SSWGLPILPCLARWLIPACISSLLPVHSVAQSHAGAGMIAIFGKVFLICHLSDADNGTCWAKVCAYACGPGASMGMDDGPHSMRWGMMRLLAGAVKKWLGGS